MANYFNWSSSNNSNNRASQSAGSSSSGQSGWRDVSPSTPTAPSGNWRTTQTTVTTSNGKQYTLDRNQISWIQSRYKADQAGTYGYDDADQYAKANGLMSAKWRKTYKNTGTDRALAEMGLPSEKNIEKYLGEYAKWHTGGINEVFGQNVPPDAWTWMKDDFKQGWEYENTAEDQARKKQGIMPKALEANYTDTEIDDELKAAGLPSLKYYDKYAQRFNNYKGIDNFYRNVAGEWAGLKLNGIENDGKKYSVTNKDTGVTTELTGRDWYAKTFYDELERKDEKGDNVYGNIYGLFKNNHVAGTSDERIDPTEDYNLERGKLITSASKNAVPADDFAQYNAFSYDDFAGKYGDYYDKYWKDVKMSDGKTLDEVMKFAETMNSEKGRTEFYDVRDKLGDGDKGIYAFIERYENAYPDASVEQMFTDMLSNGISDNIVRKTKNILQNRDSAKAHNRTDDGRGHLDVRDAYRRARKNWQNTPEYQQKLYDTINADPHEIKEKTQEDIDKEDAQAFVKKFGDELDLYMKASQKRDYEDEDTIKTAYDSIGNALNGLANADVDTVINVLQTIENAEWNNPIAMHAALQDYGFADFRMKGGRFPTVQFSGLADDLTSDWSHEDKLKLAYAIGSTRVGETEEHYGDFSDAFSNVLGDGVKIGSTTNTDHLRYNDFSYALDWAEAQIDAGRLTEGQAYNILASKGFQAELEQYLGDDWHKAAYEDIIVPQMFKQAGGAQLAMWDGMDAEQRTAMANEMWADLSDEQKDELFGNVNWWKSNPAIYRTFGQALEQQFEAILPGIATDLISGTVKLADMVSAGISGRPEMWETTQKWMDTQQYIQNFGSVYDEVNGAKIADVAASVTQEIGKMYLLGSVGGALAKGTKVGKALSALGGVDSKVIQKVSGVALDMLQASPFVVSATAHNYSEAKAMGATNGEATVYALLTGTAEGVLESMNFDKLWGRAVGQEAIAKELLNGGDAFKNMGVVAKARLMSMVVSGLGEFTEESIGYALETYLKTKSIWGEGTEWSSSDWIEQAGMGFLTGFFGGGIASGSITEQTLLDDYFDKNKQISAKRVDKGLSDQIWSKLDPTLQEHYEKGGAHVMSIGEYGVASHNLDKYDEEEQSILKRAEASKAEAKRKYDDRVNEINEKVNKAISLLGNSDTVGQGTKALSELGVSLGNIDPVYWGIAARARIENGIIANTKRSYETELSKIDTNTEASLNDVNDLRKIEQDKIQEHYAGLHLLNEAFTVYHTDSASSNEIVKAYKNGTEVTPESLVSEEASSRAAENAAETEGKAIDPNTINWFGKKTKLEKGDVKTRPFTDEDAQKVVDVAAKLKYQGKVSFIDDPEQNWNGKISLLNGDIVINKAKLTAYDVDKLQSNPALWVLEHELNHFMKSRGSESYNKFHEAVVRMLKNSPYVNGNEQTYNEVVDGLIKSREEQGLGKLTRSQAEEELVGNFAMEYLFDSEDAINSLFQTNGSVGEQILSWLRYKIDRAKLRRSKESWARDILDIERMYAKAYRDTKNKPQSEASKAEQGANETYSSSFKYNWSRPLEEIYKDFGTKIPLDQQVVVGGVNGALQKIGFSRLPIFINPRHMRYITDDEAYVKANPNAKNVPNAELSHAFYKDEFAKLPNELADPVAIIMFPNDKDKTVNVMTANMFAKNGNRALVSMHLDSTADINGTRTEGYNIKTIHGRDNYWGLLRDALKMDSDSNPQIVYVNFDKLRNALSEDSSNSNSRLFDEVFELARQKEKALETSKKDGLHSSYRFESGAYSRSLPDSGYRVNTNSQTDTNQFKKWFGQSVAKSEDGTPTQFWKTKDGEFTNNKDEAVEDKAYYLSVQSPIEINPYDYEWGYLNADDAVETISAKHGDKYDSIHVKTDDGYDKYVVFKKGQAKYANDENIGLFSKPIRNPKYSGTSDESLDFLGNYKGKSNPLTGVTAEEDEAYMRAALAGDTETAGRMVRDMYERNGLMHVYRGENEPTGTSTTVDTKRMGIIGGMFATDNPAVAGSREYTNSSDAQAANVKPLSYGKNVMTVLQRFADGVAERIGNGTNLVAESYYTDDAGNQYADDGDGRVRHWVLRDADTGEVFSEGTSLSAVSEDARRKAADIIGGDANGVFNSIEDPFAGRVLDLFVKFDNANEHDAEGGNWDAVTGDVSLYSIDVTKGPRGTYVVNVYPASYGSENTSSSERVVMSETFKSKNDLDYEYNMEQAFKRLFGENSNVFDFFAENAEWGDDGSATLDAVGVDNNDGTYIYPDMLESLSTDEIALRDKYEGYDGTIIRNVVDGQMGLAPAATDTVSYNPNYIKSGDAIVYDDNGEIIPLSERGDFARNELRYSGQDTSIEELLRRYGAKPEGREPRARDVNVPNQTNDQNRVSNLGRSILESDKVTDDQVEAIKQKIATEDWMSYIPKTNAETMEEARNYIAARQPLAAQQEFHDMVMNGKLGTKTNAIGLQLLSDAAERGDFDSFMSIATDLQIAATEAGQSAQIFNVLKELKGVGSAYYMQRVIDRLNSKYDDLIQKGKMNRITVSQDLMDKLTQAKTVDQIAKAEEAVAKEIARQVPLTWSDRLSSWRYFSMLANPTTHVRNMFGNLLMKGLNTVKDAVATGIENIGGVDADQRAHAVITSADRAKWQSFVDNSYAEQARNLSGGGKLGFETFVKQNMRSFDTKWVNALAQLNFKALEGEDVLFIRPAYKNALMQYMKAQGYTLNEKGQAGKVDAKGKFREISNADMTAAVEWASQQAWKQTFRDASSLATMLNKLSKEGPIAKLLVEGVMPFKKTPINIAKRGIEYSPAGIIMGTVQLATKVKQGKMSAATAIDNIASGITGTALMALGVFLAKAGLIRAGGEDKKKYETYLQDTGDQTYAMKFGDASINMSAIAPATIPLFMGVALNEMVERSGDSVDLSTITDTIAGTLNPFMEMSFMSSLNSALQSYSNDGIGGALGNTILSAAQNYGSQYLPTLGGKVAQFFDPTRRTTKSDATSPIGGNMDYYARSLAKKVPGLEATLQPDVDIWGRTDTKDSFGDWALDFFNKFILPTNVKVANRDSVDNELIRVVESTGVTDFLPSDGNKYFTVKGERYNMNSKQYAQFSQDRGQAAYAAIKDVMSTPAYQAASDEAKADMLKKSLDAAYKQVNNLWKDKLGAYNGK